MDTCHISILITNSNTTHLFSFQYSDAKLKRMYIDYIIIDYNIIYFVLLPIRFFIHINSLPLSIKFHDSTVCSILIHYKFTNKKNHFLIKQEKTLPDII